ncbi:MAG: helix-turn-helix domain-containing protein [Gammaproteobacteria bacterium]|nr:helix-turn-helix domain-containing protein [Gammaproteobacteria bacterium]MDH5693273.1 helix-turn-helix domain-containing protein [Gammaproteobacteria bacterium]
MGAGYLLWLARSIYVLRAQRSRFQLELLGLGSVFLVALSVVVLGMSLPLLGETLFFQLYASAIGAAFILVSLVLAVKPQLASDVSEVSREAYAVSTLKNIDCDEMLTKLTILMENETLFEQADLSLDSMAKRLGLSSHQLSELINTRLGKSFSRYLREYRVGAAKQMLLEEPSASVLAVGLSVGFTSQSNFYDAFKEIAGMTPAKFRKINRESTQT